MISEKLLTFLQTGFSPNHRINHGFSLSEGLIYGFIGVVLLASLYAVFGSLDTQRRVAATFSDWYENKAGYDKALADQKATGRPMLVYIFATWCPHCKQFSAQILSDPKTQKFVKNYPHVKVEPDKGPKERAIMDEFGAKGYPSFYVVQPGGERTMVEAHIQSGESFRLKTPEEFIASLKEAIGEKPGTLSTSESSQTGPADTSETPSTETKKETPAHE